MAFTTIFYTYNTELVSHMSCSYIDLCRKEIPPYLGASPESALPAAVRGDRVADELKKKFRRQCKQFLFFTKIEF